MTSWVVEEIQSPEFGCDGRYYDYDYDFALVLG